MDGVEAVDVATSRDVTAWTGSTVVAGLIILCPPVRGRARVVGRTVRTYRPY
jgi:hypothetical protein